MTTAKEFQEVMSKYYDNELERVIEQRNELLDVCKRYINCVSSPSANSNIGYEIFHDMQIAVKNAEAL
jgi:hypothetical protein